MTTDDKNNMTVRRRLVVRGRVQGVGFRPFVYRLALEERLGGFVGNDAQGAFIEIEGNAAAVGRFTERLREELPPLAEIASVAVTEQAVRGETAFRIETSVDEGVQEAEITPDTSTCGDCLRELLDPNDRRYRYPFINCTNCGPRYSIIQGVPYDRPNTTMRRFTMCPACQGEYDDPANRRFHAQPNACAVCGPRVWLCDVNGEEIEGDGIALAAELLRDGKIVAVKGLGGFHLACRADDDAAVARLRERKGREAKPLALMVGSLEQAAGLVEMDERAESVLASAQRPIVLLPRRAEAAVSAAVAEGTDYLGVMLPYTALHVLLFAEGLGPLVMTSGNPSDEPLCIDNDESVRRLGKIADALLLHDRDIERGVDDSVVMTNPAAEGMLPIRRARGYAPAPIRVAAREAPAVLAVGGEMKSTVCVLQGGEAVVSEHLGELSNARAYRNFMAAVERLQRLLRVEPGLVAYDLHPDYASARYARQLGTAGTAVQHHHGHIVACMAENGISGEVVGIAADGTGYGDDGQIWGGEVLVCDEADFERVGHLGYYGLVGGDLAAKETWRPAAGLLREALGEDWLAKTRGIFDGVDEDKLTAAAARLGQAVQTSSLGRLFDGVAFLLGVCQYNRYEAESPMALEQAAGRCAAAALPYEVVTLPSGHWRIDVGPMLRYLVQAAADGPLTEESVNHLARAFHETIISSFAETAERAARLRGLNRVVLSGGCFANRLLLVGMYSSLKAMGLDVYVHRRTPPGDGCLALGQAVVAAERAVRRCL